MNATYNFSREAKLSSSNTARSSSSPFKRAPTMTTKPSLHWPLSPVTLTVTGVLCLMVLCSNQADAQGALTNGAAHDGAISAPAQTNIWTVAANAGDRITAQLAKLTGGAGFTPR